MFSPFFHRWQACGFAARGTAVHRQVAAVQPVSLIQALPGLGDVLYMPMSCGDGMEDAMLRGVLVEHWQFAPLLQVRSLVQASVITVDGPREWIECLDWRGRLRARLHLLPDTDYLAWDHLFSIGMQTSAAAAVALASPVRPVCAKLLRFHQRRVAGMVLLGADPAGQLSPMGRVLAHRIARDEAVALQPWTAPDGR